MEKGKESEFRIKLSGVKLSAESEKRIESGMQSLVLNELASYTPNPDSPDKPGGGIVVIPMKWPGRWIRVIAQKELEGIAQQIHFNG